MKKKNWKRILALTLLAVVLVTAAASIPQAARAFGDFDSHSDYGGSRRSRSSGDSDSIDIYALIRAATLLGRLIGIESPYVSILLAVVIIVVLKIILSALKGGAHRSTEHQTSARGSGYRPESLQRLMADDPAFDETAVIRRVKDLFVKMQTCWEDGNIEPLRQDFMPDTWTQFNTQLQNKNAAGETAHVRNIVFERVELRNYATDAEHQQLRIRITVTHNIWTTNRKGKRIQGTEKTRKRFEFIWTMTRPLAARTGGAAAADTAHCPNCGAEIDLEAFAECPFCHTPVMNISPDWVISEIDAVSQETLHN